jgi:hypothetical protein
MVISCEKDKVETHPPPPAVVSKSFTEEFDTVANLSKKGWIILNNSEPYGAMAWRQGRYELGGKFGNDVIGFPALSAVYNQNEFVSVDQTCGNDAATLSCWLISPPIPMKNNDELIFYTRSHGDFADRMEVRANFTTASANVGTSSEDVGDFTTVLLDINPTLIVSGYPINWTKYIITLTNLPSSLVRGRFAFRYYVANGGPGGTNSDMIGIDALSFLSK